MLIKILSFYHKKRLLTNALLSVCQVLVIGATYFILFSIVLKSLGSIKLGVWSLILSTSSVANIANIGLASSLVKYIASYSPDKDADKINNLIKTGLLSIAIFIGIIALFIYVIGYIALPIFIVPTELDEGLFLLPLSLISLWINGVGGVFLSAIDGLHSSSLRSVIYIFSSLLFLLLAYLLLPHYGLVGVAIAQIIQASTIFLLAGTGLKIIFKKFSLFPLFLDKATFKQIFEYSTKFQTIGILQLFYDPTTKFLLSKYGGLDFVGFYEMSSRLVLQIRSLIVSANQVIVPTVASRVQNNTQDTLYPKVLNLVIMLAFPIGISLIILAPYISFYWIGYYEPYFIYSLIILSIGYFLNILCVPAYFSSIGIGSLQGILNAHIVMAILNASLGLILGYLFDGWGVITAFAITILIGGEMMITSYHKQQNIPMKAIIKNDFYKVGIYSLITAIIGLSLYWAEAINLRASYLLSFNFLLLFVYFKLILKHNLFFNSILDRFKFESKKIFS